MVIGVDSIKSLQDNLINEFVTQANPYRGNNSKKIYVYGYLNSKMAYVQSFVNSETAMCS